MPRLTEKLTDKVVRNLPVPATGNVLYYDPELKGFAARVTAGGTKAFVLVYHLNGDERRDTIGSWPAWNASAARELAKRWRREIHLGIDPRGKPEPEEPKDSTFKTLAVQFLAHGRTKRGRLLRPATLREYRRALMTYAGPLHATAVGEVRRSDAADLLRAIAAKRGATTAMRTRAAGSRFYSWLIANGKAESNPFTGTEGYETAKRKRVLTDGELAAICAATEDYADFNLILRIMLWTGCRRSEAGGMRWSELVDGVWVIPGERTKNHRTLALPIPRQMREALEAWPRRLGRDHLFGRGPNGFQAWSQCKRRLDARLDFRSPFDLHDIRRTCESRMAGLGIPKDYVNRTLNHAQGPITETYDQRSYLPEKAAALETWANALERVVSAPPSVVALAERR